MKRNEKMLFKVLGEIKGHGNSTTTSKLEEPDAQKCTTASLDNLQLRSLSSENPTSHETTMTLQPNIMNKIVPIGSELYLMNNRIVQSPATIDNCEVNIATPEAPLYSPITPIDRRTFLSGNNVIISESSENSSPIRSMSPDILKIFETFTKSDAFECNDFSDDDSVKDPHYITDNDFNNSSSDESTSRTKTVKALVHAKRSLQHDTTSKTRQPQIIQESVSFNELKGNDDVQTHTEFRVQIDAADCRPHPQVRKRRVSESDLKQTQRPSKRSRRSVSISDTLIQQQTLKPDFPKKKHVSDPSKWKREKERVKRFKGQAYKTIKGKNISARPFKQVPRCLTKPKHKCNENIPQELRKKIYEGFRALRTLEEQRHFIVQHVRKEKKKRSTTTGPSRKESTNHYSFTNSNNEQVGVCREFFLDTLNITEGMVRGALKKVSLGGLLPDNRGRRSPPNKLSSDRLNLIKSHILSFPAMESHYCRKNTEYKYLDSGLNVTIMYSLYKKKCQKDGTVPAGIETYRKVFRSYKLRFHVPKKDLCKRCVTYKELKSNGQTTSQDDEDNARHLKRRDDAYGRRDADKEAAKEDSNTLSFNFDLEAVLHTPKGAAGPFFYARKLAVYNLTMYKFGDQDVDCYTWDETEGKRGSVEIATCVYKYILGKEGITHVRMMSDNCGGQQKNFNFSCMLLHLVTTHLSIEKIDHVFYESGHSHMECDSIHSKIEQKAKNTPVYTPEGWTQVMRLARTNPRPFNVNVLVHDEFLDFNSNQVTFAEEMARKPTQRKKKGNNNQDKNELQQDEIREKEKKKNFQDAVWIQYRKESSQSLFIKTDYNDENFTELKLKTKRGKSATLLPIRAYSERLPISIAKKRDLMKLCHDNQIPKYYHSYYENLPVSEAIQDRLPEPDAEEDDE